MGLTDAGISRFLSDLRYDVSNLTIVGESSEWLYSEIVFTAIGLLTLKDWSLVNI
jgi:hypothetical protein